MRQIPVILLCAMLPSYIVDSTILNILKTHCENFPESGCSELLLNDSILTFQPLVDFPINEESDTIYVQSFKNGEGNQYAFIFKRGYGLSILDGVWCWEDKSEAEIKDDEFFKSEGTFYTLISNWEINTLKQIGYEYKESQTNYPYECRLTRMIIHKGHYVVDTATYNRLGDIEKFTREQLDSVRLRARTIGIPSETTSEEIVNDVSEKVQHQDKDSFQDNPKTVPSKSIWRRIAEWFIRLWHSIFG